MVRRFAAFAVLTLFLLPQIAAAQEQAILSYLDRFHPVRAQNGMVATQEAIASEVGLSILQQGGNAVDAAVAIGFALAVTLPRAGNLGGGGFMIIHDAETGETVALDYREMAPAAASRDMYLAEDGAVDPTASRFSHRASGVPGTVAGLLAALERYGSLPRGAVIEPAIALAEEGFEVSQALSDSLKASEGRLSLFPAAREVFFKGEDDYYEPGDILRQPDLARSLRLIVEAGPSAFYQGPIAVKIAEEMERNGGLITLEDLEAYRPVFREPVKGSYRGYDIASMPPPSSGGAHLIQILNLLEDYPLAEMGHNSALSVHIMAEAMRLAYADRSLHLGDSDFVPVPLSGLTSKAYADELRPKIDSYRATPSSQVNPGNPAPYESNQTTHFSVMDAKGNAVANTYTINFSYGSGIMAEGTGILLNNEMDDFSAKPGVPNAYGLIGGEANAIEAGKRPLSSMTPTIVFKEGEPFLVTGSPGGSRIITTTLQIILNVVDHGMNIAEATAAPRVHHQWLPDELRVEEGMSPDTLALLRARGHEIAVKNAMGSTQSILKTEEGLTGASDPRSPGALTLGY
ncbi:MAG: gamma-glutamyltransferase [Limibacillus sp.]|jgi:gamma-glutamyltranspeptidase/glutathione hydrolase